MATLVHIVATGGPTDRTASMITVGSVSRDQAAEAFAFLAPRFRGRRTAIKELTHAQPDFMFWIYPDGRLHDARGANAHNVPRGYEHILDDEPDYGGFLRGRIVTVRGRQLVVVYCRPTALAAPGPQLTQLLRGLNAVPVPLATHALSSATTPTFTAPWPTSPTVQRARSWRRLVIRGFRRGKPPPR